MVYSVKCIGYSVTRLQILQILDLKLVLGLTRRHADNAIT